MHFCCLSRPVCGVLLEQPGQSSTNLERCLSWGGCSVVTLEAPGCREPFLLSGVSRALSECQPAGSFLYMPPLPGSQGSSPLSSPSSNLIVLAHIRKAVPYPSPLCISSSGHSSFLCHVVSVPKCAHEGPAPGILWGIASAPCRCGPRVGQKLCPSKCFEQKAHQFAPGEW